MSIATLGLISRRMSFMCMGGMSLGDPCSRSGSRGLRWSRSWPISPLPRRAGGLWWGESLEPHIAGIGA